MYNIPVVIAAYNREHSLERLLGSISKANYYNYKDIPLIISIDYSENESVFKVAEKFEWPHGIKRIIHHKTNLGLKKHIISCGDLVMGYDALIMLEDDLIVSPEFYHYAQKASDYYYDDHRIAGISLFSPIYNEASHQIFYPVNDGSDFYFMQVPSSCGQVWTKKQWNAFKEFHLNSQLDYSPLHIVYQNWSSKTSWKKDYFAYILEKNMYFVYPRYSYTTNFGDMGTHYMLEFKKHQVQMCLGKREYAFIDFDQSICFYNQYYQPNHILLKQFNPFLRQFDFICDFYGDINLSTVNSEYAISIRNCKKIIKSYGMDLIPPELNIAFNNSGKYFYLGAIEDFDESCNIKDKLIPLQANNSKVDLMRLSKDLSNKIMNRYDSRIGRIILKPFRLIKNLFK